MSGDTGNEYNHIMRSIAKVERGFTPELVTPEMLDAAHNEYVAWSATDRPHSGMYRDLYLAMRTMDPGIAELTEAARRLSALLHNIEARTATLNTAVGGSERLETPIWFDALGCLDTALAKIGGQA